MSTVADAPVARAAGSGPATAGRGSLLRAEALRFRSRRFLRILLGLAVLGWVAATVVALSHYGVPTDADRATARQTVQQIVAQNEAGRQQCLADPNRPAGAAPEEACGPPPTAADFSVDDFLPHQPFDLARTGTTGALGFGAAAAVLAFLVGATWIGAEWSSRSLVALLFWVPRRGTVMGAKIAVLVLASALLGVLAQAAWLATAGILRAVDSTGGPLPHGFWGHLLATQGRGVLLTVVAALLGFGLTNLIRNTGAALGIGFVYFAVVETAVKILRPAWEPWLLTSNAAGLITPGGLKVYIFDAAGPTGFDQPRVFVVHNLQAGILLGVVTAVIVGAGVYLFQRRDLV
ncbi:MAG TPA: ABC transporter permease subunit [Blastococcus sp.]|jgi:hypothetical protein|nr:ABC transporter permease subunit [Blastococcus sp.]